MGKSVPSATAGLKNLARILSSDRMKSGPKQAKPNSTQQVRVNSAQLVVKMENSGVTREGTREGARVPLAEVVSDCVRRWFHDTLKEARGGDVSMQLLVGQMYNSGYGVRKDLEKGRAWITRASRGRSSAWKVSNKQPGYNVSDSESEDLEDARI